MTATRTVRALTPDQRCHVEQALPVAPEWTKLGRCGEVDPDLWFPEKGDSPLEAKRICRTCEVRAECLDYALERDEQWGIWGGMSLEERREEKKRRAEAAAREQKEAA